MALQTSQVGLFYPKPRNVLTKVISIARADSSTVKAVLPKDACITGVMVIQSAAAVTNPATYTLGWSGSTTALLNAFSLPTTSVGYAAAGAAAGSAVGTKLTEDKTLIGTFGGTSASGGTGFVVIEYFVAGPGEEINE